MNHHRPLTAPWTGGSHETGAADIHYVRTGGDKPTLLALHGLAGSGACWTPVARALEDEYDVVMPDARGHGTSSAPLTGYLYHDLAGDVLNLIRGLGLTAPVLLGHSMGGMTAAVVASQLGAALRAVILVDPTFLGPEGQREVYASDVAEHHRQLLRTDRADLITDLRLRHPHRSPEMIDLLAEARLQTHPQAFEVLTPPNPGYHELIRSIRVPILLVLGSRGIVSLATALELQRSNPRLRHELIPDAGHGLPYDQPEQVGAVVRSFLRSLAAAARAVDT